MTIAEYLRSISFEDIEEILWEVYGMGDNFTPFIKMTCEFLHRPFGHECYHA